MSLTTHSRQLLTAQQQSQASQKSLAQAAAALDSLLAQQQQTSSAPSTASSNSVSHAVDQQTPSSSGPTSSGATATGSPPSAADLIADQKAVDAAGDQLAAAEQALLQATIVSPIDGTVVAVNLSPGETVTADSSTANIVIAGTAATRPSRW